MSITNEKTKEINCKIVFYGPPRCGKTTTLQKIYEHIRKDAKGDLISLAGDKDKTLYFDFVPLSLGKIKDYTLRLHLYTVPGELGYETSRKLISKGVDGVVFIADSQLEMMESNIKSFNNLLDLLKNEGYEHINLPIVLQYNKRDLSNAVPIKEMRKILNPKEFNDFETVATKGTNIFEVLQTIAKQVLISLKNK